MPVEPGLCAVIDATVAEEDTAVALHSGEVSVLGTPKVVALCEEATVAALAGRLGPGETTVGHTIQLDHVAPTRVGTAVHAEATLLKVNGRRLTFSVSVSDTRGLVAAGKITRVIVHTDRFMEKAH